MIEMLHVSKRYPNGHLALDNVSFQLGAGEFAFLTGRSGAGKSTLLKLIAAIEAPTQGQIVVANTHFKNYPRVKFRICAAKSASFCNRRIY